jgi:hypothetical protein
VCVCLLKSIKVLTKKYRPTTNKQTNTLEVNKYPY